MSVDRQLPNSLTASPVTGDSYMDKVAEEVSALWDVAAVALNSVGGTANAITATCIPALTGNAKAGMVFTLIPAADNTAAATLVVGGTPARAIVNDAGVALGAGQLKAGTQYLLVAGTADYRVIGSSNIQKVTAYQVFTANGTWNKPAGTPDDALVVVEGWGAGGPGGANATQGAGGGGGSYGYRVFRAGDLTASVAVVVGTSTLGSPGGNTSFGAYLVIPGGGAGSSNGTSNEMPGGGGGGSPSGQGGSGSISGGGTVANRDAGVGGWEPLPSSNGSIVADGENGIANGGGGGGVGDGDLTPPHRPRGGNGGKATYGGAGGGGYKRSGTPGSGGASVFGGNGGNPGAAGQIPGGGGGGNAVGGRGELRIRVIG